VNRLSLGIKGRKAIQPTMAVSAITAIKKSRVPKGMTSQINEINKEKPPNASLQLRRAISIQAE
jgi:hypothetical protein